MLLQLAKKVDYLAVKAGYYTPTTLAMAYASIKPSFDIRIGLEPVLPVKDLEP